MLLKYSNKQLQRINLRCAQLPAEPGVSRFEARSIQAYALFTGIQHLKRLFVGFLGFSPGFAIQGCANFKLFCPSALVQKALPAIILQALVCFRGSMILRGPCTPS